MLDAFKGWPLIFFAVHASRVDIVGWLLDHGTDPNILTPEGVPLLAFVILSECNREML